MYDEMIQYKVKKRDQRFNSVSCSWGAENVKKVFRKVLLFSKLEVIWGNLVRETREEIIFAIYSGIPRST